MKARPLAASPVLALLVSAALAAPDRVAGQASSAAPPPTRSDNVREVLHGVEMVDPYRWLEDQNSPETRAWIDAQNRYTRSVLDSIPGRERLSKRIAKLLKVDSVSEPVERKGKYFFTKRLALFVARLRIIHASNRASHVIHLLGMTLAANALVTLLGRWCWLFRHSTEGKK